VLRELFLEHHLSAKLNTGFETFHHTYKEINRELWKQYNLGLVNKQELRNNRFHETFNRFSYNNYNENLEVTEKYLARSPYGKHLKEGCLEILEYLKPSYSLHVITNGFKEVQNIKISECGLKDYFGQIIISEEHQLNKPDEKIFRLSERLVSCNREECVMIGDNYDSDISGALGAGWQAIWLNEAAADNQIHSIKKLEELKKHF
jgi:putative hydrolase of the HAD superfamily